jgi:glycosyltransferase involved in cell wall biosynthesis
MKVVHVFRSMGAGGAEVLVMNLFRALSGRVQFDFILHSDEQGIFDDEIRAMGGRIYRVPEPRRNLKAFEQAVGKVLQDNGPYDAIHSHPYFFSGIILRIARRHNVPCRIAHSHNTQDGMRDSYARMLYRWYMRRLILRHATHLLGCSREACGKLFGSGAGKDPRQAVFHNALNAERFLDESRGGIRGELGMAEGAAVVHIGRFTEQKNHRRVVDIFHAYLNLEPEAQLLLVGDGPLKQDMIAYVQRQGLASHVRFLGIREDIPAILSAGDLFLFPSLFEGLGNVVIEAQLAGVPCLVSDTVPREADIGIGTVRYLPLAADDAAWARAMAELKGMAIPDREDRHAALKHAGYDIHDAARSLEGIYAAP